MQQALSVVIVIDCVANLGSIGVELNLGETFRSLRSINLVLLSLGWSWVVGLSLAYLLTRVLPMAEPYATLNTESTYDWQNDQWTVPLNLMVQQLVKIGKQPVALTLGGRYYADKPDGGPDWGLRFAVIFLFPK